MEPENFNYSDAYQKAQVYELKCNNHFVESDEQFIQGSKWLLESIKNYKNTNDFPPVSEWVLWKDIVNEFFEGSVEKFDAFVSQIKDKHSLEIGSGPCGVLNVLFNLKERSIIEPLLNGYKEKQISLYEESWFNEDINCYSQPAEILVPELVNKIDGMIVCRNCIDHTQDWQAIMKNIASYAAVNSYFLFWSDLYHNNGADEGHFNVTNDKEYFRNYVKDLGYEIQSEWSMNEETRACVNMGFVAKKIK